jgi:hypothetical protein
MAAEIINWTGQLLVIPRPQLHELARREELLRTGVYVLVGPDPQTGQERVYFGEADEVFARLRSHDVDLNKDFWNRAVAITSKDFNLTKAHGRYLESRLIEMATSAKRSVIENGTAPGVKTLPESDVADMEYFLQQIELILPVLGFSFLQPIATKDKSLSAADVEAPVLMMSEVGADAMAREIDGRFVVLKDSTARKLGSPSWDSYKTLRDELVTQSKMVSKDDKLLVFAEDVEFSSPSAAAAVVAAANRNGRIAWHLNDGRTYAEWKESQAQTSDSNLKASRLT